MIDELIIALLTSEFGQVWARYDLVQCAAQNWIRLWATCFTKSHTTLGKVLYKIAHEFVSPGLLNRIRFWAGLGLDKIWYDVTNLSLTCI